jgi:hypothetical protein
MEPVTKLQVESKQILLLGGEQPREWCAFVIGPLELGNGCDRHHIDYSAHYVLLFERFSLAAVGEAAEVGGDGAVSC